MDRESVYELQKIDCNCNDCKFMVRDFKKLELHKESYKGTGIMDRLTIVIVVSSINQLFLFPKLAN